MKKLMIVLVAIVAITVVVLGVRVGKHDATMEKYDSYTKQELADAYVEKRYGDGHYAELMTDGKFSTGESVDFTVYDHKGHTVVRWYSINENDLCDYLEQN